MKESDTKQINISDDVSREIAKIHNKYRNCKSNSSQTENNFFNCIDIYKFWIWSN
jgi:hypothetical protein